MPSTHPKVFQRAGDRYLHDFRFTTGGVAPDYAPVAPWDVTGHLYTVTILTDEFGTEVEDVLITGDVLDGPTGVVRVICEAEFMTVLLATSPSSYLHLRDDTIETTVASWPLEVLP